MDPEEALIRTAILLIFALITLSKVCPKKSLLEASRKTFRTELNQKLKMEA
jgi:hypothetical protein